MQSSESDRITVTIDKKVCAGSGICVAIASKSFDFFDNVVVVIDPAGDELDVCLGA